MHSAPNAPLASGDDDYQKPDIVVTDPSNPRSVINLVPDTLAEVIRRIPSDLLELSEEALKDRYRPSQVFNQIRLSFWKEYDRVQMHGLNQMVMSNVYAGVCTHQYFYQKVVRSREAMCWILCPPTDYMLLMEESLMFGIDRLREILELPLYEDIYAKGDDGELEVVGKKINTSVGNLILKTVALLDNRVKGAVVQRLETKSLNMNVEASAKDAKSMLKVLETQNMEELNKRLTDLRRRVEKAQVTAHQQQDIEVKAIDESKDKPEGS